jgi:predicted AAA+ superfamily ATPase
MIITYFDMNGRPIGIDDPDLKKELNNLADSIKIQLKIKELLTTGSSILILGKSGTGKTQLLKTLEKSWQNALYINLQLLSETEDFYRYVCGEIGSELLKGYRLRKKLQNQGISLLLIDEGDKLAELDRGLQDYLRALSESGIKIIMAARNRLTEICTEGMTSPLYNVFLTIEIEVI